ncbi:MAG: hypothetical protein IJ062_00830 [Firmicutes bacterium]|nr:hypothetical protein [Bacillota bacterium]
MKFKRSIAFAAIISSIMANSFCVYAWDEEQADLQPILEQSTETADNTETLSVEEAGEDLFADNDFNVVVCAFDGGSGTLEDPYCISTPEQLNEIRNNMSANYVLTADIDMSAYENYEPIGTFVPLGSTGEEAETPTPDYAFTGVFDGAGHTISGLAINKPEGFTVGLFGCVSGGVIKNVNFTNANVSASMMSGCCIGYLFDGSIENVHLSDSVVNGTASSMGTSMIGGIAGAGMDSKMSDCTAENVTLNLADNTTNAGIAAGGFEVCTISNVNAEGTINAGESCMGLGGVAGCNFDGDKIENCTSDVVIKAGSNAYLIGGITGYAGGFESMSEISGCNADVDMTLGENSSRIGGIIGGGFFNEAYTSVFPNPAAFKVDNCTANGSINCPGGKNIGSVAGYTLLSEISGNNTADVLVNGAKADVIGDTENYEVLNALQGTYLQFFTDGVFNSKYDSIWHDYCAAVVGESAANDTVAAMKRSIGGKLYGEEAIAKYSAAPETTQFFCDFTNDIATITIDGSNISGKDKNGNTVFSHTYYYLETADSNDYPGFTFDVFKTNEDAGEFQYFAFAPDTPATTYHTEFRYCGEYDDLLNLLSGKYAYWLAAGIRDVDLADDKTTENVIALFCTENMNYSGERSAESLAQLKDITGRWNCDMTDFRSMPEYANADMYIELNEDGSGKTYLDITGSGNYMLTSDYLVYTYDNSSDKKEGIYVVYTDDEGVKYSKYKISENNGIETLDFYDVNGNKMISYYREKINTSETGNTETTASETKNSSSSSSSGGGSSSSSSSGGGKSSRAASVNAGSGKNTKQNTVEEKTENEIISNEAVSNQVKEVQKNIVLAIDSPVAKINGIETKLGEAPVIINGRTMVPIRFVSENLGYSVDWDADEKKVTISLEDTVIELTQNSEKALVNGDEKTIDSPAVNRNGSILVPLRFVAETLGADVEWNALDKTVTIK